MLHHVSLRYNKVILQIYKALLTFIQAVCPGYFPLVGEGVKNFQYAAGEWRDL
jgi:hypothetical protein